MYLTDNGDIKLEISGIGADRLESESGYRHVIEGKWMLHCSQREITYYTKVPVTNILWRL